MGNYTYISFNRAVSDEQFTTMLETVAEKHLPFYEVKYSPNPSGPDGPCWVFRLKEGILTVEDGYRPEQLEADGGARDHWSLYIWRSQDFSKGEVGSRPFYKGKFEHKTRGGDWKWWFADQLHGYMSMLFKSKSGGEACPGTWKTDPAECPTYKSWLEKHYHRVVAANPEWADAMVAELPKKLQTMPA